MPFPFEKGLSIAPGYATSIGLRKVWLRGAMSPISFLKNLKRVFVSIEWASLICDLREYLGIENSCRLLYGMARMDLD